MRIAVSIPAPPARRTLTRSRNTATAIFISARRLSADRETSRKTHHGTAPRHTVAIITIVNDGKSWLHIDHIERSDTMTHAVMRARRTAIWVTKDGVTSIIMASALFTLNASITVLRCFWWRESVGEDQFVRSASLPRCFPQRLTQLRRVPPLLAEWRKAPNIHG